MKNIQSKKAGVTFLELLIYMAIVTVMLSSLVQFAWNIIGNGVKSNTEQEVYAAARYVSERIKYEIRNANSIGTVATNSLSYTDGNGVASTILLSGGKVKINKGTAIDLHSADTTASLTFTDYSSLDNKTKHIAFTLTIQANYGSARQEYQESISLRSSAEMRSN